VIAVVLIEGRSSAAINESGGSSKNKKEDKSSALIKELISGPSRLV